MLLVHCLSSLWFCVFIIHNEKQLVGEDHTQHSYPWASWSLSTSVSQITIYHQPRHLGFSHVAKFLKQVAKARGRDAVFIKIPLGVSTD